jgi:hypothetical protein
MTAGQNEVEEDGKRGLNHDFLYDMDKISSG